MPGIWNKSGNQVFGLDGAPEVGARCYFFEASSSTPLTTYTDYSLAVPNPAFVETDNYGRWPAVFLDDSESSFFRERATNQGGSVIYFDNDVIPIIGPGEGGGAPETPVDPNALLETGDIKIRYGTGTKAGFVRLNGRTIGSAVSGASERANADTQDLFEYLYGADANLTVSGGRGASATADYEANKTITLPDFRGRVMAALDDMGAAAAGILTGFTTLGEVMGVQATTLTPEQIPELSATTTSNGAHRHLNVTSSLGSPDLTADNSIGFGRSQGNDFSYSFDGAGNAAEPTLGRTTSNGAHDHTVTVGESSPSTVATVTPSIAITTYMKL